MIDASQSRPQDPDDDGNGDGDGDGDGGPVLGAGGDPTALNSFRRQIDAIRGRVDTLGPDPSRTEVFEALETTIEEHRVAVEELRQTNEALLDSRGPRSRPSSGDTATSSTSPPTPTS